MHQSNKGNQRHFGMKAHIDVDAHSGLVHRMLVESPSRAALQRFLANWQGVLFETRRQGDFKSLVRWAIDVDPLAI